MLIMDVSDCVRCLINARVVPDEPAVWRWECVWMDGHRKEWARGQEAVDWGGKKMKLLVFSVFVHCKRLTEKTNDRRNHTVVWWCMMIKLFKVQFFHLLLNHPLLNIRNYLCNNLIEFSLVLHLCTFWSTFLQCSLYHVPVYLFCQAC